LSLVIAQIGIHGNDIADYLDRRFQKNDFLLIWPTSSSSASILSAKITAFCPAVERKKNMGYGGEGGFELPRRTENA
jgi:hypothetical protein